MFERSLLEERVRYVRRVWIFQDEMSNFWKEELLVVRGKTEVVQTVLAHLPREQYENRESNVCGDTSGWQFHCGLLY